MSPPVPGALEVRSGSGRLCRTEAAVLFSPMPCDGWEQLVAAAQAAGEEGLAPIARVLAERLLDAPALVYVTWRPQLAVLVFGDAELCTDQPTVPMLTGRGSRTWVEHSLLPFEGTVVLSAEPPEESGTDLRAGVIPADGFRLTLQLSRAASAGTAAAPSAGTAAAPSAGTAAAPSAPATPPPAVVVTPDPPAVPTVFRPPRPDASPEAALGAIRAAAVTDDPEPPASPPAEPGLGEPAASDGEVDQHATRGAAELERPLVDAVLCSRDHANPPGQAACRRCGTLLSADTPTRAVPQPVLATLRLDDNRRIELAGDLLIGRRPRAGSHVTSTLIVDHVEVSREHARLLVRGWELLVEDLGSRNGTYVVPAESRDPVQVSPEVPVRIDPGAAVYLGSVRMLVEPVGP